MRIDSPHPLHLTYCTNIHAADGWPAVRDAVGRHAPALKARFSPDAPFGIGLRLSARDARELWDGGLDEFKTFLAQHGLYVAIINGFPFGSFHGTPVKEEVYAPDWRTDERVRYTRQLIGILAALLPDGLDGGVSTVPLSYKRWMSGAGEADWTRLTRNVIAIAEDLIRRRLEGGPLIHLDIEPEPDCVLENTDDTLQFFERVLIPTGSAMLSRTLQISPSEARDALLDHIRICFDCCHFSVAHEHPRDALARMHALGLKIGRIQLSSALRVDMPGEPHAAAVLDRLRTFADSTYLHQVICRGDEVTSQFPDLPAALEHPSIGDWRVHFHVPLFTAEYEGLQSTQEDVRTTITAAVTQPITTHLEIETYTWDVLPGSLKIDLVESIAREYAWVLEQVSLSRVPTP